MPCALPVIRFRGVWRRESIAIDGGDPFEDSEAYWLQVGEYFGDMRWPREGETHNNVSAFAGRTLWQAPKMHFVHEIDLHQAQFDDIGEMSFQGDRLIERGEARVGDQVFRFEEVWVTTAAPASSECRVACATGRERRGYLVRVDDHVVALEETDGHHNGGMWRRRGGDWVLQFGLGRVDALSETVDRFVMDDLAAPWTMRNHEENVEEKHE